MLRNISGAAERNKAPIGDMLANYISVSSSVLEVASGTLQHASYLADRFPDTTWTPSDVDPAVIAHYELLERRPKNLNKPIIIDAIKGNAEALQVDLVLCINMIHIAPWEACLGLMKIAANCLKQDGLLITYGPYFSIDSSEAPSNLAFDQSLRSRNSEWGVRDVNHVIDAAAQSSLKYESCIAMPANNYSLVFKLSAEA